MGVTGSAGRLGRRSTALLAIVAVVGLIGSACSKSGTSGPATESVFVQKFRFHGMPTTLSSGQVIINFTNRESLPITHEMVVIGLPQGKSAQDVINDAKAKQAASEDDWLHFGEIGEVDTGATISGVFDLPAGTYALACWQDGKLGGGKGRGLFPSAKRCSTRKLAMRSK